MNAFMATGSRRTFLVGPTAWCFVTCRLDSGPFDGFCPTLHCESSTPQSGTHLLDTLDITLQGLYMASQPSY